MGTLLQCFTPGLFLSTPKVVVGTLCEHFHSRVPKTNYGVRNTNCGVLVKNNKVLFGCCTNCQNADLIVQRERQACSSGKPTRVNKNGRTPTESHTIYFCCTESPPPYVRIHLYKHHSTISVACFSSDSNMMRIPASVLVSPISLSASEHIA